MSAPARDRLLISIKETAHELGDLTEKTVYNLLDRREIESVYLGRRRMVVYESLRAYVDRLPTYPEDRGAS